jgi:hypothetical protein
MFPSLPKNPESTENAHRKTVTVIELLSPYVLPPSELRNKPKILGKIDVVKL